MTKYRATVACDPSSYGDIELEAESPEAAIAQITAARIEEVTDDVEYLGATEHRIVTLCEVDGDGDAGEVRAEGVPIAGPNDRTIADRLRDLIAEGLTAGEARNIFAQAQQDQFADEISEARATYANDDLEIDDTPEVSEGDGGCWVAAWVWVSATSDPDVCQVCNCAHEFCGCLDDEESEA